MISKIEEILIEGKNEILPNREMMFSILNQIPEKKNIVSTVLIKSPYLRTVLTQVISLCFLLIVIYPTYKIEQDNINIQNEFDLIDKQNDEFGTLMDQTDYDESFMLQ